MRVIKFSDSSYVVHGMTAHNGNRISAWFDKEGGMLDYQGVNKLGKSYKPCKEDKEHAKTIGSLLNPN